MIIGITGGTGSGKTTLLQFIEAAGGVIYDCDQIYHQLLETDSGLQAAIAQHFPNAMENGKINRKMLGNIVFQDTQALATLNAITHTAVKNEILHRLESEPSLAAIDAIGLFEGHLDGLCDITVAVTAPRHARIARIMARDGISEEYARNRVNAQQDDSWYQRRCDHTLENDGDYELFVGKCLAFLQNLGIIKENEKGESL